MRLTFKQPLCCDITENSLNQSRIFNIRSNLIKFVLKIFILIYMNIYFMLLMN